MKLTRSQLVAEVEKALARHDPEDAYTSEELEGIFGLSNKPVRQRLRALAKMGRLETVRVMRADLKGVYQPVPAYRILPG